MRSDHVSLISATRCPSLPDQPYDPEARNFVRLYYRGEYKPGKDQWQHLCEACPLPDCIRDEGDYTPLGGRDYPGCPVWEEARKCN